MSRFRKPLCLVLGFTAMLAGGAGCARPSPVESPLPTGGPNVAVSNPLPLPLPTQAPATPFTRDACIRQALRFNRPYRNAASALERSRLGIDVAEAQVFSPKLNATWIVDSTTNEAGSARVGLSSTAAGFDLEPYVRFGYVDKGYTDSDGVARGDYDSAIGLAITRKLFNISEHLKKRQPVAQADRAFYTAANRLALAARQLEAEASRAFYEVQRLEARLVVRRRSVASTAEFLAAVKDGVAKGFKAPLEATNAEISANQAQIDLISDETADLSARENLNQLLGRSVDAPLVIVAETLDAETIAGIAVPPLERDLALVLSDHETIGNRRIDLDDAIERTRIARDQLMPQVTARLAGERRWGGDPFFHSGGDGDPSNAAILTLTYETPLDGWKAERAQLKQVERQYRELTLQLAEDQAELERRLRGAHRRIIQVSKAAELAAARVAAERARFAATERRYQAGAVDNLELTRARETVDNAEVGLLDARISAVTAAADYRAILPVRLAPPQPADDHE